MKDGRGSKTPWLSLGGNLAYALFTGGMSIYSRSWWFLTLAAYYILLALMRFVMLYAMQQSEAQTERSLVRLAGSMCLLLSVTLAGAAYLSVSSEQGRRYHEIVMITIALYAFTKITLAIVHLVRIGSTARPAVKCLRNLSLADGAVSIFSLQRSMLLSFQGMSPDNISLMNALTGTAVYLLVAFLGINLIGGTKITMAKSKIMETNEKIAASVTEGYKKIEGGVVSGYTRLEDKFIDRFLTREGETVEQARDRLKQNR